ncbi:MAG: hypothetical protein LH470_12080 [Lysobacter sp.]|nr:hypothetical protein [Lysobacter sp.]
MSENNLMGIAAVSDDNAVHRLFEIIASGDLNSQEFMVLDALVYQRLARNYDETSVAQPQLHAVQAA